MGIEAKFNLKLDRIEDGLRLRARQGLKKALDEQIKTLQRLNRSGRRFDGSFLPGYKPSYKKLRRAAGLQTSKMDLTVTGTLLDSLFATTRFIAGQGVTGTIDFKPRTSRPPKPFPPSRVNSRQKAQFLQDRFRFFGVSDTQAAKIKQAVERAIRSRK